MDKVQRYINSSDEYTLTLVNSLDLVKDSISAHQIKSEDYSSLIDVLNATILLSSNSKEEVNFTTVISNNGRNRQLAANSYGKTGFNAAISLSDELYNEDYGLFEVIKFQDDRQISHSQVDYEHYVIGDMLANYFAQSEQLATVVMLGSLINENHILSSTAFMIQLLPDCSDETISKIESFISKMNRYSRVVVTLNDQLELFNDLDTFHLVEEYAIKHDCHCSFEQTLDSLVLVDRSELEDIIEVDGCLHVKCNFCAKDYYFNLDDLNKLN